MKRLIVVLMVLALAVPAMAQEKKAGPEWNFGGSARVYTFWTDSDLAGGRTVGGDGHDTGWDAWDAGQSRIFANVRNESVRGYFEVLLPSGTAASNGSDQHDGNAQAKQIWGQWNFMDGGFIRVGKDNTPVSQFISRQAYAGDRSMLGYGTVYGRRNQQIKLGLGGFQLALLQPIGVSTANRVGGSVYGAGGGPAVGGDVDMYVPKMEASYQMKFDMFEFRVMGGYQTYSVEAVGGKDYDIDSYIVGGDIGVNVGAFYFKAAGSYGENWTSARWADLSAPGAGLSIPQWNGDKYKDTTSWMASGVLGLKITDAVTIEWGAGWRSDDVDISGAKEDDGWNTYLHATIALAKNVYILPEVGYYDQRDNVDGDDQGSSWYAGARWQIDF